jgi:hypothetical protein
MSNARVPDSSLCPDCGVPLPDTATAFLHRAVHAEPWSKPTAFTLCALPAVLMPRIARLMQAYADSQIRAQDPEPPKRDEEEADADGRL